MADINIYGRLWCKTKDGEIASASQIKDSAYKGGSKFQNVINNELYDKIGALPTSFKTINGTQITGTGDITIDLSLYKVVTKLPTTGIDDKKIYLVKNAAGAGNDVYTEYVYVTADKKWEKLGEYKSTVDLTPYVKFTDVATTAKAGAMSAADKTKLDGLKNYTLPTASATVLGGIKVGAGLTITNGVLSADDGGAADTVDWTGVQNVPALVSVLAETGYVLNVDRAGESQKLKVTSINADGTQENNIEFKTVGGTSIFGTGDIALLKETDINKALEGFKTKFSVDKSQSMTAAWTKAGETTGLDFTTAEGIENFLGIVQDTAITNKELDAICV